MKKLIAVILLLSLFMTACGKSNEPPVEPNVPKKPSDITDSGEETPEEDDAPPTTVTVTDTQGRTVEIPYEIDSVVCMGPSALRTVCYLGVQDRVVGIEDAEDDCIILRPYNYLNQQLRELPIVSQASKSGLVPFEEELLKVKPDVILMAYSQVEVGEDLQNKLGIPVVFVNTSGAIFEERWFDSLNLIASMFHCEERADEIISYTNSVLADLKQRTDSLEDRPTAYLGAASARGEHGIDGTILNYPPFTAVNINHVADELAEEGVYGVSSTVDMEKILEWDPEYIFLNVENVHLVEDLYKENPDFFANLSAFQNDKVFPQLSYNNYGGNLELAIINAYYAGSVVYPETFADINIDEIAAEAFNKLLGKSMWDDMNNAGVGLADINIGK